MNLEQRINAFSKLGDFLSQFSEENHQKTMTFLSMIFFRWL
ncbi:hypothetical protein BN863_14460 [Formosa agariphila KMM 3901]|uniref:Uncharacterized protein n=1 Tax=Formosa agariphila (strain DSM 15362 / KCTC 12365 / LMG 23005 / KMM 3901 / M-2Alg 35-1) TaxID=1347342 RepID=T2KL40_FORAG|nr:hypothetical protein BN863_14460 [Formosa agariphila KMM 3901]